MALALSEVVSLCLELTKSPSAAAKAASVCYAESGGNPTARCYNVRDPRTGRVVCYKGGKPPAGVPVLSIDRGLCQFNDKWHPEVSTAEADNPRQALKHMFRVSGGFTNFSQWTAYGTERQKKFERLALGHAFALPAGADDPSAGAAALGAVGGAMLGAGGAVADAGAGAVKAVKSIPEFLELLSNPKTWIRILEVVVGAASIVLGAFLLQKGLVAGALGSVVKSTIGGAAAKAGAAG